MIITRKRLVYLLILILSILLASLLILRGRSYVQGSVLGVFSFLINIIFFSFELIKEAKKYRFSFSIFWWIFNLFFLGLAPFLQFLTNKFMWGMHFTSEEIVKWNIYILIWAASFCIGKKFLIKIKDNNFKYAIRIHRMKYAVAIALLITGYYVVTIGISNMLFRATNTNSMGGTALALITSHGFRDIVLFCFALIILVTKEKRKISVSFFIIFVCFLLSAFPTGLSRNISAAYYIGIVVLSWEKLREKEWFTILIVVGLLFVFPALGEIRHVSSVSDMLNTFLGMNYSKTYLTADYDAYTMTIATEHYVKLKGFSLGYQLIGALLFFVPRAIWTSKPIGTGATVMNVLNPSGFNNVSAPLIAESYVNFGLAGIVVVGFIVGLVIATVDKCYWRNSDRNSLIRLVYPFSMVQFFFLLRGDLMSSGSYMLTLFVVGYVMWRMFTKKEYCSC